MTDIARFLIIAGVTLVVVGVLLLIAGKLGLGRLPGDVVIRGRGFTFYFPIVTSILLSRPLKNRASREGEAPAEPNPRRNAPTRLSRSFALPFFNGLLAFCSASYCGSSSEAAGSECTVRAKTPAFQEIL